jgi:hypothetical protein
MLKRDFVEQIKELINKVREDSTKDSEEAAMFLSEVPKTLNAIADYIGAAQNLESIIEESDDWEEEDLDPTNDGLLEIEDDE